MCRHSWINFCKGRAPEILFHYWCEPLNEESYIGAHLIYSHKLSSLIYIVSANILLERLIIDRVQDLGMSTNVQRQEMRDDYYYRRRQIYIRIIEQLSGEEAIDLINTLDRMDRFKWMLDLRVRIR